MQTNNDVLLRLPQVLAIVPVAKSTWWSWVKSGKAPAPVKISAGVTCWRKSDIDRMTQQVA
jgi:prophage regulatory protein